MTLPSLAGSFGSAFANGCCCQADGSGFTLVSSREICEDQEKEKTMSLFISAPPRLLPWVWPWRGQSLRVDSLSAPCRHKELEPEN